MKNNLRIVDSTQKQKIDTVPFPIIGIGGASGVLPALEQFFKYMPAQSGMAFVLVFHQDSDEDINYLKQICSYSHMPVIEVQDGVRVLPDHIYLSPCGKDIGIHKGNLLLFDPSREKGAHMCIDYFFQSLAEDQGKMAVGIILSGLGADGETGVRMIKEKLGMTMAQEPDSAEYPSMPAASVKTQLVDYVLPTEEMPGKLIQYLRHPALQQSDEEETETDKNNNVYIQKILLLLRSNTGHDFSLYKKNTIFRRIERRIAFLQLVDYADYVTYLRENPMEIDTLFNELLIGVTKFFRDRQAFDLLRDQIEHIVKSKKNEEPIRIWIAGCSTGEEAYSVAILISEFLEKSQLRRKPKVQIFATDLDSNAIEHARTGFYFSNIVSELSKEQLHRFFVQKNNGYMVKKEIREMIVFAQHNLVKDAPFTRLDLLCCRNVMIYLTAELQKKLVPIFHYSLLVNGILFLGPAESISGFHEIFNVIDSKWKIFQRKEGISSISKFLDFPFHTGNKNKVKQETTPSNQKNPVAEQFNKLLLDRHTPPSLLLNERGEILYVNGKTNRYIQLQPGEATMNVHRMVREELKYVLGNALHQAHTTQHRVEVKDVKIKETDRIFLINFVVEYLDESPLKDMLLVTFSEMELSKRNQRPTKKNSMVSEAAVDELQKELNYTKQQLHTSIEQMETSLEELKSTNEELQSTNEELQSTNEEALTTKEEMQSLNEQLMSINLQYQKKAEELTVLQNDMKNLLDNTESCTVFLNNDLHILRYTPQASKLLKLSSTDIGKLIIPHLSIFNHSYLEELTRQVIETLNGQEIDITNSDGEHYLLRIAPYRTTDNFISGAVLSLNKKTKFQRLNFQFKKAMAFAQHFIDQQHEACVLLDEDHRVLQYNHSFIKLFQLNNIEPRELYFTEIVSHKWNMKIVLEEALASQQGVTYAPIQPGFIGTSKRLEVVKEQIFVEIPDQYIMILKFREG
ncbi:CheR family methyltransferase [Sphingobacterium sp. LRF_L2]|uniref:CheR family methyltransferase n=1 Tax=Sphingobacterium sp. LRF_L2 TaxID=3369421 RepID=UPI003F64003A